jgi:cephalosporin-C deacetylase
VPQFDLSLEKLESYRPEPTAEPDFDGFWTETLDRARMHDLEATFTPAAYKLETVEVLDVRYSGWNGERIAGWLILPRYRSGPLPTVVEFIGYGGGRSLPYENLIFSAAGYAHFIMDTRGQGSTWGPGVTPDPDPEPGTGQHPGFMTRGIGDPRTYYYRRLITDAVRAVDAARAHPAVDDARVAVYGRSQGGGLALAAAALATDVAAALPDVPFLCHYRRAVEITDRAPYSEIATYLGIRRDSVDQTFRTLSYFDGINFAPKIKCPMLTYIGLEDDVCPPETGFAVHNAMNCPKELHTHANCAHDAGIYWEMPRVEAFLAEHLKPAAPKHKAELTQG